MLASRRSPGASQQTAGAQVLTCIQTTEALVLACRRTAFVVFILIETRLMHTRCMSSLTLMLTLHIALPVFSRKRSTRCSELQDANCLEGILGSDVLHMHDLPIHIRRSSTKISFRRQLLTHFSALPRRTLDLYGQLVRTVNVFFRLRFFR